MAIVMDEGLREALDKFKKPIAFPQDKEDPSKKDKLKAMILGHFIYKLLPIDFSHPSIAPLSHQNSGAL
jgi:hypothetical protein